MQLDFEDALSRLSAHDHGVLSTVHPSRGVDAVPVVFAVVDSHVGIPIDRVKPKSSMRLQRERNLATDPRATLLVEQWHRDDWSRLWWVRAELHHVDHPLRAASLEVALAAKYPQYVDQPFERVLVLRVVDLVGWAASAA